LTLTENQTYQANGLSIFVNFYELIQCFNVVDWVRWRASILERIWYQEFQRSSRAKSAG